MFVRRAARTVWGLLKRGSERRDRQVLSNATSPVVEAMEGRVLLSGTNDTGYAVLALSDGRTLMAGISEPHAAFAMYDAQGTLDPSFGTGGKARFTDVAADIMALAEADGGKVVAVGSLSTPLGRQMLVMRLNPDGSLDGTFGSGGIAGVAFDSTTQPTRSLATGVVVEQVTDANGTFERIVVAGDADFNFDQDFVIARFDASGAPDPAFGHESTSVGTGVVRAAVPGSTDIAGGLAVYPNGNIVMVGSSDLGTFSWQFSVARFLNDGQLDSTFGGGDGFVTQSLGFSGFSDIGKSVALVNDKILIAGTADSDFTEARIGLARFSDSGDLDTSFGEPFLTERTGYTVEYLEGSGTFEMQVGAMTTDAQGRIFVAGVRSLRLDLIGSVPDVPPDVAVVRYDAFGTRDMLFGDADGVAIGDAGGDSDQAHAVALRSDGTILVGGRGATSAGGSDFALLSFSDAGEFTAVEHADFGTASSPPPLSVTIATASGDEGAAIAVGSAVTGGTAPIGYQWTIAGGSFSLVGDATSSSLAFIPADDGAYTLTLTVTDGDGAIATDTTTVTVNNVAPTIDAGPDVQGAVEGTSITVTAAAFGDVPSDLPGLTVGWTLTDASNSVVNSGAGAAAEFVPPDDGAYTLTFTVTDDDGAVGSDSLLVTVTNANPVAAITGSLIAVRQWEVALAGSFSDAGALDTHSSSWQVTDAAGLLVASGSGSNITFTPVSSGLHAVTFTVTDDDGGVGAASASVDVVGALIVSNVLRVGGTSNPDDIQVRLASTGEIKILFDGVSAGLFAADRIIVRAGSGADAVSVASGMARQTSVYGGPGNDELHSGNVGDALFGESGDDSLLGSAGSDILVGGDGEDLLVGGKGDDLLIGGLGADRLVGNTHDDILVGGWTLHDADIDALNDILLAWSGRANYASGIADITAAGLVADVTVFDDAARDVMSGNAGLDVFYGNFAESGVLDVITDLKAKEFEADLDLITAVEP